MLAKNLAIQTYKKSQWTFLRHRTGADLSSQNNFTNLGSFAKVFVPVETIVPWFFTGAIISKVGHYLPLHILCKVSFLLHVEGFLKLIFAIFLVIM